MMTKIFLWSLIFFYSSLTYAETCIEVVKARNFSPSAKARMFKIINNLQVAINHDSFKQLVINYKINGVYRYENNNNDTNIMIYEKIMSGSETLGPNIDQKWNLDLNLKWLFSRSTLAYTDFSRPEIYINSRYFGRGLDSEIAGTICHEYTHKLGYSHDNKDTPKRANSVPYVIGSICEMVYANTSYKGIVKQDACGLWCRFKRYVSGSIE